MKIRQNVIGERKEKWRWCGGEEKKRSQLSAMMEVI
jgi:hypothetical protein